MKKIILLVLLALVITNGYSQKKGAFRVGLDAGYVPTGGGGGGLLSLEGKYNLTDNMNVGLRFCSAGIARNIETGNGQVTNADISGIGSIVGTYDYYIHIGSMSLVPYFGAGIGYYSIANVEAEGSSYTSNIESTSEIGGLIRGGIEWGKLRVGLEYNIVPDSNLQDFYGNMTNVKVETPILELQLDFI
jgi:outer membrane protein W